MKILVTGATGFLGGAVVERLLARGEKDIRCLVRGTSNRTRLAELMRRHPDASIELFEGSLGSKESLGAAVEGVSVVYHLAASLHGAAAQVFESTVAATGHLLDAIAAQKPPPRLVLVGSFGVYGVADLPEGAVLDEQTPLEPHPERRDLYSQAKLKQEQVVRRVQAEKGFPLVVLRPGVVYGPRGGRLSARVGLAMGGVFLHLGGENLLPLTYVDNCADAIVLAGQSPGAVGQTYNVVDDDLVTCAEYLRRYQAEVGPLRVVPVAYPTLQKVSKLVEGLNALSKGRFPALFTRYKSASSWKGTTFDNRKLKGLGWRPMVSTEEGLGRTFAWFKTRK